MPDTMQSYSRLTARLAALRSSLWLALLFGDWRSDSALTSALLRNVSLLDVDIEHRTAVMD